MDTNGKPPAKADRMITYQDLSDPKKRAYLEAYSRLLTHVAACKETGSHVHDHYRWMKQDGLYAEAFANSRIQKNMVLEDTYIHRAMNGFQETRVVEGPDGQVTRTVVMRQDPRAMQNVVATHLPQYRAKEQGDQNVMVANLPEVQIMLPDNGRGNGSQG